jgi:Zn-finger nucleic acid-binding protein
VGISDEQWLAAARARAASGSWERSADEVLNELRASAKPVEFPEGTLRCPFCAERPPLSILQRYEAATANPLRYCNTCYGFWAVGDALTNGIADPDDETPALSAALAPRRCRACFGHLKPDNTCARCGKALPLLNCPQCGNQMQRIEREKIQLDQCAACMGVWFDTGEIAAVYHLQPAQGLAMSTVDEHATDGQGPDWLSAAMIVGRMALPFLPL